MHKITSAPAEPRDFEAWWLEQVENARNRRDGDDWLDLDDCDKDQYQAAFDAGARCGSSAETPPENKE